MELQHLPQTMKVLAKCGDLQELVVKEPEGLKFFTWPDVQVS